MPFPPETASSKLIVSIDVRHVYIYSTVFPCSLPQICRRVTRHGEQMLALLFSLFLPGEGTDALRDGAIGVPWLFGVLHSLRCVVLEVIAEGCVCVERRFFCPLI